MQHAISLNSQWDRRRFGRSGPGAGCARGGHGSFPIKPYHARPGRPISTRALALTTRFETYLERVFFYAGLSGGFDATPVSGRELYQSILRVKYMAAATATKLAI